MSKKIKVLILAPIQHEFPPVGYGPWELVAYNLAEGLVDLGVDVTVFTTESAKTRAKKKFKWESPADEHSGDNAAKTWIHIVEGIKEGKKYDIVHNHLNIHPATLTKLTDVNMVTTLHGAASEPVNKLYYQYLKDQKYVSISIAEREYAPELNYVGNVYNGVDFSKYDLSDSNGEYLLFSGRIIYDKGIEDSIKVSQETGIPLKIAGLITDNDYFDRKVKPHLGKNIEYLGNLGYEDYSKVLKSAKALLSLIHWDEPFGLTNIDALASGVPVVAYDRGSLSEIVYDKEMGAIVRDTNEAAGYLMNISTTNPAKIRDLAKAKFSREAMAKGYLEIYNKIVV